VGAATDIGWAAGDFSTVIKMEPDGTVFADPVIVTSSTGELLALNLPSSATQSKPELLPLASNGAGLELSHFSYLAFVPAINWCESSGWSDTPNSPQCSNAGAATTLRSFGCKNYRFCSIITASCCVEPGDASAAATDGCSLSSAQLGYSFITTDSNGGQYPYCDTPTDGGGGDAGTMTCSEAVAALNAGTDAAQLNAESCSLPGDGGVSCAVALDWTIGVSCTSFCASIGQTCVYAAQGGGANLGADCTGQYATPQQPTTNCALATDLDTLCYCN
ncbi:MAG TPA: hypothetical protein VL137_12680, partial [Polyangiaceae bacterium]|nr:hypothetical protein [Polyangiaceae bacterium]